MWICVYSHHGPWSIFEWINPVFSSTILWWICRRFAGPCCLVSLIVTWIPDTIHCCEFYQITMVNYGAQNVHWQSMKMPVITHGNWGNVSSYEEMMGNCDVNCFAFRGNAVLRIRLIFQYDLCDPRQHEACNSLVFMFIYHQPGCLVATTLECPTRNLSSVSPSSRNKNQ